jgi:hypothetical protein
VTITPTSIRESIRTAIVLASGLPDGSVVWGALGQPIADPTVRLFVTVDQPAVPNRITEVTLVDPGAYSRTISTMRELTIQCRVESLDGTGSADALSLADQLTLALDRQDVRAIIEANQDAACLGQVGPILDMTWVEGDYQIQAREFDFQLRVRYDLVDPSANYVFERATVQVESETAEVIPPEPEPEPEPEEP